jgi:hypothetical protein
MLDDDDGGGGDNRTCKLWGLVTCSGPINSLEVLC